MSAGAGFDWGPPLLGVDWGPSLLGLACFASGAAVVLKERRLGGGFMFVAGLLFCLAAVRFSSWFGTAVSGAIGVADVLVGAHVIVRGYRHGKPASR